MESGVGIPLGSVGDVFWVESYVSHRLQYLSDDDLLFFLCLDGEACMETVGHFGTAVLPLYTLCAVYVVGDAGGDLLQHADSLL